MAMPPTEVRFTRAGRAQDVPAGTSRLVQVEGRPILLAHWEGCFFAFAPICPHRNNPLEGAKVWDFQLQCPWHHFRYDLRTGQNLYPRNVYPLGATDIDQARLQADLRPLRCYPVEVRDGEIYIGLPD